MPKKRSSVGQKLAKYKAKRNFKNTPEPTGTPTKSESRKPKRIKNLPLKFCVQKHRASHLHYDFRLEHKGVLLSWAVPKGPSLKPSDKRLAMNVEDHPLDYRKFEGVIPEGYGAGVVMLWDEGIWTPQVEDVDAALETGDLKFSLAGTKLKGSWALVRIKPRSTSTKPDDGRTWLLIKHADEWSGNIDITKIAPLSVKSFSDFDEILSTKPRQWKSNR